MLKLWGHWPPVTSSCCQHAQGWRKTETVYLRSRFATWVQFHQVVLSVLSIVAGFFRGFIIPTDGASMAVFVPCFCFPIVFCHFWTNNRNTSKERTLPTSFPRFVAFPPMNCHTFPGYATSAVSLACPPCSRLITSSNFGTSDAADLSDIYHRKQPKKRRTPIFLAILVGSYLSIILGIIYMYIYIYSCIYIYIHMGKL